MIQLTDVAFATVPIPLFRAFRFGIVELKSLEHLVIRCRFLIDGRRVDGFAGENLVPKWFAKDPATTIEQDIAQLRAAATAVAEEATQLPPVETPYALWTALASAVGGQMSSTPPLVRQLGVSLIERCGIDAFCRAVGRSFFELLKDGSLGVPRHFLGVIPAQPAQYLDVRHTVGLADELPELPKILQAIGIRRLKIKLAGDGARDVARLVEIDRVAGDRVERITLDGNENYPDAALLADFLQRLQRSPELGRIRGALAWIEQPVHRSAALLPDVADLLRRFPQFPHVIDESDDSTGSLPRALALGYAGTTHKNCKGVFKSILAAHELASHASRTGLRTILSGEDLTIVAPWAQVQDLAVAAAVGVVDVERNGHHYADGLSAFPPEVATAAVAEHPGLYRQGPGGVARLIIRDGRVDARSATSAFGFSAPRIRF